MVTTPRMEVINIPINKIRVNKRLREVNQNKIQELANSIKDIGLLHPITVSKKDNFFYLISGNHRLHSFKHLQRTEIPATINGGNKLVDKLIEIEENLVDSSLTIIQESIHIKEREELLVQLGRRAKSGENRYTRTGLTNQELADGLGMSKRNYLYFRSIANMDSEVLEILDNTEFANNRTDLITLTQQPKEVQLLTAKMLQEQKCTSFKRAILLARCECVVPDWNTEQIRIKELIGKPNSVVKFNGDNSDLSKICNLATKNEQRLVTRRENAQYTLPNYSQHPDHSAYFINYYSNEGDLILDCFAGSGVNIIVGAALGRKCIGYDLSESNINCMKEVCLKHTSIKKKDLKLHISDGVELKEYKDKENFIDLITIDPPYGFFNEHYENNNDSRDLATIKDQQEFFNKLEICLKNLKRLIKPSNFNKKEFHPIILKLGSWRRGDVGLHDMSTDIELIGRKLNLVLHDKVINILDSHYGMFNVARCMNHKYSLKIHETNLVFLKYSK